MNFGEKCFTKLKGRWNNIVKPTKKKKITDSNKRSALGRRQSKASIMTGAYIVFLSLLSFNYLNIFRQCVGRPLMREGLLSF